jgi:hypothetical protein
MPGGDEKPKFFQVTTKIAELVHMSPFTAGLAVSDEIKGKNSDILPGEKFRYMTVASRMFP